MADEAPSLLSIAELAEQVGLTRRTIRYYVAEGLLPAPGGRGQRRVYTAEHLARLRAIQRLKEAFLPLSEIRRRLREMTAADFRRLATDETDPANCDPLNDEPSLLSGTPRQGLDPRGFPPASLGPFMASPAGSPFSGAIEAARRIQEAAVVPDDAAGSVWRRVTLAPGVELHYQLSGDRRRDEAIAHLIRAASSILR